MARRFRKVALKSKSISLNIFTIKCLHNSRHIDYMVELFRLGSCHALLYESLEIVEIAI